MTNGDIIQIEIRFSEKQTTKEIEEGWKNFYKLAAFFDFKRLIRQRL